MFRSGKTDLEKLILLVNLGILHSLKNNYIDINEAEYFLYTPYMLGRVKLEVRHKPPN